MEIKKGLENVAISNSSISSIIGTTLTYRGFKIEDLSEHASFEEVIFLLWNDRLPTREELTTISNDLYKHAALPSGILQLVKSFPKDANTMEMLRTGLSALAMYDAHPTKKDPITALSIQAKIGTLVAAIGRISKGEEPLQPLEGVGYAKNFLYMLNGVLPSDLEEEAMNKALILHADHEFNASTFSGRVTVATLSDMYSGITSAIGTLKGPLHGGANEQVMNMLREIGTLDRVDTYLQEAFSNKKKIMGIGHRVYKEGDPRAFILKDLSQKLTAISGKEELFSISVKIHEIVEKEKGLKPNVDFYSASMYDALNIPSSLFTPIFAVSRASGWLAHIMEQYSDNRLIRPRAEYTGKTNEVYVPIDKR